MAGEMRMVEGILLVDGYNVINAWPELVALKDEELDHARERLIAMLSEFRALSGVKIYLVFDAHHIKEGNEKRYLNGGIIVIYTKAGETADRWIERFVALKKDQLRHLPVFVATFDWLEQRIILGQGAYRVTPTELYQEMQLLKKEEKRFASPPFERDSLDSQLSDQVREIFEHWRRNKFDE